MRAMVFPFFLIRGGKPQFSSYWVSVERHAWPPKAPDAKGGRVEGPWFELPGHSVTLMPKDA